MKRSIGCALALIVCVNMIGLSGCSADETTTPMNPVQAGAGMEQTPIVDYAIPEMQPNVLVNQRGYQSGNDKEAVVKGKILPGHFEVIDTFTEKVVYNGELTQVEYHPESDCYIAYANFSDFEKSGDYYLRCDVVGESVVFSIDKQIYTECFLELLTALESECMDGIVSLEAINRVLIAYEWYPELFPDEDGDKTPDMLKTVADWIEEHAQSKTTEGDFLAAVLAKFSYLYQNFDRKYANQCLQMASNLYSQSTGRKGADSFYALTELYRASGLRDYEKQILEQAAFFEGSDSYLEQVEYLYGSMTYLVTRKDIDIDLCSVLMSNMMARAEEIANMHSDTLHPLSPRNNGEQDVLKKAFELACANYVMNNYQYNHVQEEFFHYMMGRNRDSLCMYEKLEDKSSCLVLLAQLANIYI